MEEDDLPGGGGGKSSPLSPLHQIVKEGEDGANDYPSTQLFIPDDYAPTIRHIPSANEAPKRPREEQQAQLPGNEKRPRTGAHRNQPLAMLHDAAVAGQFMDALFVGENHMQLITFRTHLQRFISNDLNTNGPADITRLHASITNAAKPAIFIDFRARDGWADGDASVNAICSLHWLSEEETKDFIYGLMRLLSCVIELEPFFTKFFTQLDLRDLCHVGRDIAFFAMKWARDPRILKEFFQRAPSEFVIDLLVDKLSTVKSLLAMNADEQDGDFLRYNDLVMARALVDVRLSFRQVVHKKFVKGRNPPITLHAYQLAALQWMNDVERLPLNLWPATRREEVSPQVEKLRKELAAKEAELRNYQEQMETNMYLPQTSVTAAVEAGKVHLERLRNVKAAMNNLVVDIRNIKKDIKMLIDEKRVHVHPPPPMAKSGILAVRPGLGKIRIALCHLLVQRYIQIATVGVFRKHHGTIIVTSPGAFDDWYQEFMALDLSAANFKLNIHHPTLDQTQYRGITSTLEEANVIVTTGEGLLDILDISMDKYLTENHSLQYLTPFHQHLSWRRIIFDESQNYSNPTSDVYKKLLTKFEVAGPKWCWGLSSTPVRNAYSDVLYQLQLLGRPLGVDVDASLTDADRTIALKQSLDRLMPDMARVIYTIDYGVGTRRGPRVTHKIVSVKLPTMERKFYNELLAMRRRKAAELDPNVVTTTNMRAKTFREMKLAALSISVLNRADRQALVDSVRRSGRQTGKYRGRTDPFDAIMTGSFMSACMDEAYTLIGRIRNGDRKPIVVFSTSLRAIYHLVTLLRADDNMRVQYVDGGMSETDLSRIRDAARNGHRIDVLLTTYATAVTAGTHLGEAGHIILLDSEWNVTVENEAMAYVLPVGEQQQQQESEVEIHRLCVHETVDDDVVSRRTERPVRLVDMLRMEMNAGVPPTAEDPERVIDREMVKHEYARPQMTIPAEELLQEMLNI